MPQSVTNKPQAQIQSLQKKWDKLQYLLLARHILAVSVGTAIGLGYLFLGEGITTPGFSVVAGAIPALALEVLTWVPAVFSNPEMRLNSGLFNDPVKEKGTSLHHPFCGLIITNFHGNGVQYSKSNPLFQK